MSRLWADNPNLPPPDKAFSGNSYKPERDFVRLSGQWQRVWDVMKDGQWRSLEDIALALADIDWAFGRNGRFDSEAAISARLRDFRKAKFGGHTVERRYVANGLHEYKLIVRKGQAA